MEVTASLIEEDKNKVVTLTSDAANPDKIQPKAFSVATSPEFVMILSKSFYSDGVLAMVREIIANAWDAHIAKGISGPHLDPKEEIPIEVTLTKDSFTVTDHGPGIADEDIEQIYLTYGESTKTLDNNQTGGFGLGSKAPFAVSSSFTVTSDHGGYRTIYNMIRSSEDAGGIPTAPIIFRDKLETLGLDPSKTGITVSVPLNECKESIDTISAKIRAILIGGERRATFNYPNMDPLEFYSDHLGLRNSPSGFVLTKFSLSSRLNSNDFIFIKYGTIIYAVEKRNDYSAVYNNLSLLHRTNTYSVGGPNKFSYWCFEAPPGAINITPNREALNYTDKTVKFIKDKLDLINSAFLIPAKNKNKQNISQYINKKIKDVVNESFQAAYEKYKNTDSKDSYLTIAAYAINLAYYSLNNEKLFTDKKTKRLVSAQDIIICLALTKSIKYYMSNRHYKYFINQIKAYSNNKVRKDYIKKLDFNDSFIYYYISKIIPKHHVNTFRIYDGTSFIKLEKHHLFINYNFDTVCIADSIQSLHLYKDSNAKTTEDLRNIFFIVNTKSLVQSTGWTSKMLADKLESHGVKVIRVFADAAYKPVRKPKKSKAVSVVDADNPDDAKPTKKRGYLPLLKDCLDSSGHFSISLYNAAPRTNDFEYVICPDGVRNKLYQFNSINIKDTLYLFPDTVVALSRTAAHNAIMYNKNKGTIIYSSVFRNKLEELLETDPVPIITSMVKKDYLFNKVNNTYKQIMGDPVLSKTIGISSFYTETDKANVNIISRYFFNSSVFETHKSVYSEAYENISNIYATNKLKYYNQITKKEQIIKILLRTTYVLSTKEKELLGAAIKVILDSKSKLLEQNQNG